MKPFDSNAFKRHDFCPGVIAILPKKKYIFHKQVFFNNHVQKSKIVNLISIRHTKCPIIINLHARIINVSNDESMQPASMCNFKWSYIS